MPDSRYAISNVEWPEGMDSWSPGPKYQHFRFIKDEEGPDRVIYTPVAVVPAFAYEELYEVTCELVAAIEAWKLVEEPDADITNNLYAAVARFKGETE